MSRDGEALPKENLAASIISRRGSHQELPSQPPTPVLVSLASQRQSSL